MKTLLARGWRNAWILFVRQGFHESVMIILSKGPQEYLPMMEEVHQVSFCLSFRGCTWPPLQPCPKSLFSAEAILEDGRSQEKGLALKT